MLSTKLWRLGFAEISGVLLASAVESLGWGVWWLGCESLARRPWRAARWLANACYFPVLACSAGLVFAHTWFFYAAVERRLTIFDITWAGISEFWSEALSSEGRLSAVLIVLAISALTAVLARRWAPPRLRPCAAALNLGAALTAAWGMAAPRVPSALFDSAQECVQLLRLPRVRPERGPQSRAVAELLVQEQGLDAQTPAAFRKVVVLVMETMTARKFEEESRALPAHTFVHAERAHAHRYTRYFPNNQDSRTGMLNMLFSRVIPHEAYSDAGVRAYEALSGRPGLVDRFRARGYQTAFAVSQVELEAVVGDLAWDAQLHWTPAELAEAGKEHLCLQPDEWENGCEDLALLPKVVRYLAEHERAFVYQEFIWGHAREYNEQTGRTNSEYYSAYVDALLNALRAQGLLDDTLIALTSDHGFRDKSLQSERWVYEIPLWFYAPRFEQREHHGLVSHTDFGALLAQEMSLGTPTLDQPLTMIVGPTGTGMLTTITRAGELLLMRRRGDLQLLVAGEQREKPGRLLAGFEAYREQFARWVGK